MVTSVLMRSHESYLYNTRWLHHEPVEFHLKWSLIQFF